MSTIIEKAREIVEVNGMSDKITLLQGKMEEVTLPVDKVDIIISEWMGYFLLYESMLDTVLLARDKYLAPGGLIFPDKAHIYMAAIEDGDYKEEKIGCEFLFLGGSLNSGKEVLVTNTVKIVWNNVYGFNFAPLQKTALAEPLVDTVEMKAIVTDPGLIFSIDLYTVTPAELAFSVPFSLSITRNDFVHALISWFDIEFTACHKPIRFSTGPHAKYTHWKQTVFYLQDVLTVNRGETIVGNITSKPTEKNRRDLDVKIDYRLEAEDPHRSMEGRCEYKM